MEEEIRRQPKKTDGFTVLAYVILTLLALLTLFPFYSVAILSVTNTAAYAGHSPYMLPYVFDLSAFREVLNDPYFRKSLQVTLVNTFLGTALNMTVSVMAAYALSRKRLAGRSGFTVMILVTMLFSGGLVPTYLTVKAYGLQNQIWAMIFPCMINSYYVLIMKNYFMTLPDSLEEAAKMDGANDFQVLTKIMLPVSKPFMATFTLFYAVERWNEWWNAYLYIFDKDLKPLQIYLRDLLAAYNTELAPQLQAMMENQHSSFPMAVHMSAILLTMLPIVCVYPFVQKYFVKGMMLGSVKQ